MKSSTTKASALRSTTRVLIVSTSGQGRWQSVGCWSAGHIDIICELKLNR